MESEKFERILAVRASEKEALSTLNTLASHLKDRVPIARDSLAREEFKEKTTLQIQVHADLHLQLLDWAKLHWVKPPKRAQPRLATSAKQ